MEAHTPTWSHRGGLRAPQHCDHKHQLCAHRTVGCCAHMSHQTEHKASDGTWTVAESPWLRASLPCGAVPQSCAPSPCGASHIPHPTAALPGPVPAAPHMAAGWGATVCWGSRGVGGGPRAWGSHGADGGLIVWVGVPQYCGGPMEWVGVLWSGWGYCSMWGSCGVGRGPRVWGSHGAHGGLIVWVGVPQYCGVPWGGWGSRSAPWCPTRGAACSTSALWWAQPRAGRTRVVCGPTGRGEQPSSAVWWGGTRRDPRGRGAR